MLLRVTRLLRAGANVLEALGARRQFALAPKALPDAYDFVAQFRYGSVATRPFQIRSEMLALLELIGAPRSVLELGTASGGTLFLFSRVAAPSATLVTVDMDDGPFGGGYPRSHSPLLRSFARERQVVKLIRGNSRAPATIERVRKAVAAPVDFLFIDADHTAEGVRADFDAYSPLVVKGGIIALHDIVPGPSEAVGGVPGFWAELKDRGLDTEEIVADWNQGGYGIGVVRKR